MIYITGFCLSERNRPTAGTGPFNKANRQYSHQVACHGNYNQYVQKNLTQ